MANMERGDEPIEQHRELENKPVRRLDVADVSEPLDLGAIAKLFKEWPGPTLMAVGTVLVFAAAGLRVGGAEFSGREFVGVEFAAVFLGGMALIAVGVAVLLVRERLLVEDQERLLSQKHQHRLEKAQSATMAAALRGAQMTAAAEQAAAAFDRTYEAQED